MAENDKAMRTEFLLISLTLLVAGCGNEPSPQEKARSDAADVAMVLAAQERQPPIRSLAPEPITSKDVEQKGLSGGGCSFVPGGSPDSGPVLLASQKKAVLKLGGKLSILAADSASAELPNGARTEYAGRTHAIQLMKDSGAGYHSSEESRQWPASLIITDEFERVVFKSDGTLDCGAVKIKVPVGE